jgi:predicted DNA binding CopG/RHH family protein
MNELEFDENELLDLFENNQMISDKEKLTDYIVVAKNTIEKNSKISIRVNEKDLRKVKSKAIEVGVPYQTLINMIIHQYAENKIKLSV